MGLPLEIGPLAERDVPAWLSLVNSGLTDCPGFESVIDLDHQRSWGGERAGLTLVAERGGEHVGAVSLLSGQVRGRLRDLVVRPDARRSGIGTALIAAALDHFRERGLGLAEGQDWDAPSYRAFYRALGFRAVRRYLLLEWDLTGRIQTPPVNQEVTVRQATPGDLAEIADLYARMYSPYWDWSRGDETVAEAREKYRTRFAGRLDEQENDRIYLVAALGHQLVGGITVREDRKVNQARGVALGSLNPGGVGVLPAYRRRGIGSRLLQEALSHLRERGMRRATVWTFSYLDRQAPAVSLYVRAGASVIRRKLGWERTVTPS